jgi:WD40 repeat protein/tRNA A-37 threonylcarbamoyl transferase component Bud32
VDEPVRPANQSELRIDRVCDQFEQAWKSAGPAGENRPLIEQFVTLKECSSRPWLIEEILALDIAYRRRLGERPSLADYKTRFPDALELMTPLFVETPNPSGPDVTDEFQPETAGDTNRTAHRSNTGSGASAISHDLPELEGSGFEILSELGRGGMGVVVQARHVKLNRVVALKMVLGWGDRKELIRFLAEAESVAAVRHPNVVQVYEYGELSGRPYMALEYLPGGTLDDRLKRDGVLDAREAAALVGSIAAGVAAAHAEGIVHRDLKPGNVLFDAGGEPKVADFGLAKKAFGEELTQTGAIMGTPAYMAPEQASGGSKFVGPQADVWALGVILFQCLSGRRPFMSERRDELLAQILTSDPEPLSSAVRKLPRDIELICRKCLEKNPAERYATARELADDLSRFAAGEPISIRPTGLLEWTYKWAKRKPAVAALYAGMVAGAVLVAVTVVVALFARQAAQDRDAAVIAEGEADAAKKLAEEARDQLHLQNAALDKARAGEKEQRLAAEKARDGEKKAKDEVELEREKLAVVEYGRAMEVTHHEWQDNNVTAALSLLNGSDPRHRGWEWGYLERIVDSSLLTLKPYKGGGSASIFSPDGSFVLGCGLNIRVAILCDARTGIELLEFKKRIEGVDAVSFCRDGSRVAIASQLTVKIWDGRTGTEILALKDAPGRVSAVSMSPDGLFVATAYAKTTTMWDARTGAELFTLNGHAHTVSAVSISPDGSRVLTGSGDETAKMWDAKTGAELFTLKGYKGWVRAVTWSPDGSRIATGSDDKTVKVRDSKTGADLFALKGHKGSVNAVAWSPGGSRIATGSSDQTARVWDARTGDELLTLRGHTDLVTSVSFSSDGSRIATGSTDLTAKVWDARTGADSLILDGGMERVYAAAFSPDGTRVIIGGYNRYPNPNAKICDARTGAEVVGLKGHQGQVYAVSWSPDGSRVITGCYDHIARIWDARTGAELLTLKGHTKIVSVASFSPDGTKVLTASWDGTIKVWDALNGEEVRSFKPHTDSVYAAKWSPDGSLVLSGSSDGTAKVWNASTGAVHSIQRCAGFSNAVSWSPKGPCVVTVGMDGKTKVWDARDGAELFTFKGQRHAGVSVAWSPDGSRVAISCDDKSVKLFNSKTGAEMFTLKGHTAAVSVVTWSKDGSRLMTGSFDGMAKIWDSRPLRDTLPPDREVAPLPHAKKKK